MNIKKLLNENLIKHQIYENIKLFEGAKDFPDANVRCINPNSIVKWLNDELNRLDVNKELKRKDKIRRKQAKVKTTDIADVIITGGNIRNIKSEDINQYIENFKKFITIEPETIMDSNPKMVKTDSGKNQYTVNTGLPALVGIIWDKDDNNFKAVSSCPGAGSCVVGCYARKAFYLMDDSKTIKLARRLNLLWNNPEKYEERILEELRPTCEQLKKSSIGRREKMQLLIRWNDAGDFFSKKYVEVAVNVTKKLLEEGCNVISYAYTKSGEHAITLNNVDNFIVNFSTDAHPSEVGKVDTYDTGKQIKRAERVPKELFKQFFVPKGLSYEKTVDGLPQFAYEEAAEDLRTSIYQKYGEKYGFDLDSLLFTFELPTKETNERNKYNLIVLPTGDSDVGAQRKDVKISFLLAH